jgi:hypothetical protein
MKNKKFKLMKNLFLFTSLIVTLLGMNSCIKEKFDEPPINIPTVNFSANKTIAELKAMYSGGLDSITDTIIIKGTIISSDESGNIYKTLYIQDNTGGIMIALDRTNLYTTLKPGQRIYVKCQGLFLGNYGGLIQLGYKYNNSIGRIPDAMIDSHIFRDSLPGKIPNPLARKINTLSGNDLCMLIKIDSLYFEQPGVEFAPQSASATDRILYDLNGNSIILRTSKYANFASNKTPKGIGSVTAILSSYNGTYQLYINSINDLKWDTTYVLNNLLNETFNSQPTNWIIYSVASNKNWEFDATNLCMSVNGYGADVASNDWLITPEIDLTNINHVKFSFKTWTKYTDNGTQKPLSVWISDNYSSGNPTNASWTEVTNATIAATNSQTWTNSGNVDISSYAGKKIRIAFKYISSGTGSNSSSQWKVDDVKVTVSN